MFHNRWLRESRIGLRSRSIALSLAIAFTLSGLSLAAPGTAQAACPGWTPAATVSRYASAASYDFVVTVNYRIYQLCSGQKTKVRVQWIKHELDVKGAAPGTQQLDIDAAVYSNLQGLPVSLRGPRAAYDGRSFVCYGNCSLYRYWAPGVTVSYDTDVAVVGVYELSDTGGEIYQAFAYKFLTGWFQRQP